MACISALLIGGIIHRLNYLAARPKPRPKATAADTSVRPTQPNQNQPRRVPFPIFLCFLFASCDTASEIFIFGPVLLWCSSYFHRQKKVTMQRTQLNIVATLETSVGRLPSNLEAERSILGAVLLDNHAFNDAAEHLRPEEFSIDSHRRIYSRMMDLAESSRPIDIITLVEELEQKKDLQAVGDVGYISGLLDGVPDRPSIEHYVRIVRDKAILRGLISVANAAIAKASEQADPADEILNEAEAAFFQLSEKRIGKGFQSVKAISRDSGGIDALLQRGRRITGLATHYISLDDMTSGFQKSDLGII